jgi:hypothetical protein
MISSKFLGIISAKLYMAALTNLSMFHFDAEGSGSGEIWALQIPLRLTPVRNDNRTGFDSKRRPEAND